MWLSVECILACDNDVVVCPTGSLRRAAACATYPSCPRAEVRKRCASLPWTEASILTAISARWDWRKLVNASLSWIVFTSSVNDSQCTSCVQNLLLTYWFPWFCSELIFRVDKRAYINSYSCLCVSGLWRHSDVGGWRARLLPTEWDHAVQAL